MKNIIKHTLKFLIAGFFLMISLGSAAQQVVVIVNNENPVNDLKQIEAKLYYLKKIKQTWPSINEVIRPVERSGTSESKSVFLKSILKMTESEVEAYFKQRQFANAEPTPPSFASDSEIIRYVSENKGAIGYVSQAAYSSSGGIVKAVLTQ